MQAILLVSVGLKEEVKITKVLQSANSCVVVFDFGYIMPSSDCHLGYHRFLMQRSLMLDASMQAHDSLVECTVQA